MVWLIDKGKQIQMNKIVDKVTDAVDGVEVKHFALTLDKDGKEVRTEIKPRKDKANK